MPKHETDNVKFESRLIATVYGTAEASSYGAVFSARDLLAAFSTIVTATETKPNDDVRLKIILPEPGDHSWTRRQPGLTISVAHRVNDKSELM